MIWKCISDRVPLGFIEMNIEDSKFQPIWEQFKNNKGSQIDFFLKKFNIKNE